MPKVYTASRFPSMWCCWKDFDNLILECCCLQGDSPSFNNHLSSTWFIGRTPDSSTTKHTWSMSHDLLWESTRLHLLGIRTRSVRNWAMRRSLA